MQPKLYSSLAEWWPLVSDPSEYVEEAAIYRRLLNPNPGPDKPTLLELGCGGGNNAFHLKPHFHLTLTDLSTGMLAHSQRINPECEHIPGDMRSLRLGRHFDCVLVHDAICSMTTLEDLRLALTTAFVHCRPGGVALIVPDAIQETFSPATSHGGNDGKDASLRYLEWTWDPDPTSSIKITDYIFVLRQADGTVRTEHDRHLEGVFTKADWLSLLSEVGFSPRFITPDPEGEIASPVAFLAVSSPAQKSQSHPGSTPAQ